MRLNQPRAQLQGEPTGRRQRATITVRSSPGLTRLSLRVTIGKERPGSLLVLGDATLGIHRHRIAELSSKHRLPTSGSHSAWAESGLLMSYGTDFVLLFRRSALLVDKVLKGARPADLPVEQPTNFELVINVKTAKALGLTVPASLLARADRVIE